MRHIGVVRLLALTLALAVVSACSAPTSERGDVVPVGRLSVDFVPVTVSGEPGAAFVLAGGGGAFDAAVAQLRAAGLQVTGEDRGAGTIRGLARSNALLDCGTVVIQDGGTERRFPGNAATAAVPVDGSDGTDFNLRELGAETRFAVSLTRDAATGGTLARISEDHTATLTWRLLGGEIIETSDISFAGSQIGTFEDGTTCTSSGELRRIILG